MAAKKSSSKKTAVKKTKNPLATASRQLQKIQAAKVKLPPYVGLRALKAPKL